MINGSNSKETSRRLVHLPPKNLISSRTKKISIMFSSQWETKVFTRQFCVYSKSATTTNSTYRSNSNFQIRVTLVQNPLDQATIVTPFQNLVKQACSSSSLKTNQQNHILSKSISSATTKSLTITWTHSILKSNQKAGHTGSSTCSSAIQTMKQKPRENGWKSKWSLLFSMILMDKRKQTTWQ